MIITTTAIGFSLLSLGLAFCGLRFFRAFQKIGGLRAGSKIGILLSSMFFSNAIALGVLGLGALFFAGNSEMLYRFLVMSHFPLTLTAIFNVYSVFYILFPYVSRWPAVTATAALGMAVTILTIISHPHPFIDTSGGIDWNMSRLLGALLSYLVFINVGAPLAIFIHSFLQAKSREVKVVSLTVILVSFMGIVNMFTRFLLPGGITFGSLSTRIFDAMLTVMGLILLGAFLLPSIIIAWLSRIKSE